MKMNVVFDWKEYAKLARKMVAEGCVLVRNEDQVLPLVEGAKLAVFGRMQCHYLKSGTGSGGLVNAPYVVNLLEGLEQKSGVQLNENLIRVYKEWVEENPFDMGGGWAQDPWFQKEMHLEDALVKQTRAESDIAMVVIGRQAGEDRDNSNEQGSYLLTDEEHQMLQAVTTYFDKVVVVLNVGNVIDMNWAEQYNVSSVLYIWQGGCEGGNGVADILTGDVNPSGKLTDTIAKEIADYPSTAHFGAPDVNMYVEDIYVGYRYFETFAQDKVLYPFGFGLSYTDFSIHVDNFQNEGLEVKVSVTVKNIGAVAGKEVVQVYVNPPQGLLGKPVRNLVAYGKTSILNPGESETLELTIDMSKSASYDDSGVTGHPSCFVLEAGYYEYYVGSDVRCASIVGAAEICELQVVEELEQACAPIQPFERIKPDYVGGKYRITKEETPLRKADYEKYKSDDTMLNVPYTGDKGHKLIDVYKGNVELETFIAQLSDLDMIHMSRGEGMSSPKVTLGTGGAFGGVTDELKSLGIPMICCSDGPSGIRMDCGAMAYSLPNGAILASSFNIPLCSELFDYLGMEMNFNHIDTLLGPGLNIHRNPLNGRNFEYFSEDPYLTGTMAIAQLKALHPYDVTATIKHFACNSQEFKRSDSDSVLSERALREIYWKAFEMAVKEGGAYSIMTSYNAINGLWAAGNYDMLTTVLREEWGYMGSVMTDWWAKMNEEGQEATCENTTLMIKAQNDSYMVVEDAKKNTMNDNAESGLASGTITRNHLARNAMNLCRFILKSPALRRMEGCYETCVDEQNRFEQKDMKCTIIGSIKGCVEGTKVPVENINTTKTTATQFYIEESGSYKVTFEISADIVGIAQVPMTIYNGVRPIKMVTLNQKFLHAVTELEMDIVVDEKENNFVKLFFGESGIVVENIVVYRL